MRIEVVDAMALEGSAVSAALISDLREKIGDATPDVALLFLSSAYFEHAEAIATRIVEEIGAAHFVGVCSSSVIGNEREFENEAAASLWTAQLPEYAEAQSFGIKRRRAGAYEFEGQEGQFADPATLFLFSIPGTFSEKDFLSTLRESQPESQVLGGRTCGERGQQLLFHAKGKTVGDPFRREEGAVAINLAEVYVCAVVSQGCRPFGKASTITKADGNELQQLGSHSASERFDEEVESLSLDERRLLKPGAHIGRLLHTSRARGEHGDFQI
ncbi:MAG: FIST N-terminal domain-containing protein, partial [Planctomycetota bacterium]